MDAKRRQEIEKGIAQARAAHPGKRIDCYVLFSVHYDAMATYEAVRAQGKKARVSTTPRDARSCCGVSLLIDCDDAVEICDIAAAAHVELEGVAALPCQIDPKRDRYC